MEIVKKKRNQRQHLYPLLLPTINLLVFAFTATTRRILGIDVMNCGRLMNCSGAVLVSGLETKPLTSAMYRYKLLSGFKQKLVKEFIFYEAHSLETPTGTIICLITKAGFTYGQVWAASQGP